MKLFRRTVLAMLVAFAGMVTFSSTAQGVCIEDPINEGRCLPLCPRKFNCVE